MGSQDERGRGLRAVTARFAAELTSASGLFIGGHVSLLASGVNGVVLVSPILATKHSKRSERTRSRCYVPKVVVLVLIVSGVLSNGG